VAAEEKAANANGTAAQPKRLLIGGSAAQPKGLVREALAPVALLRVQWSSLSSPPVFSW